MPMNVEMFLAFTDYMEEEFKLFLHQCPISTHTSFNVTQSALLLSDTAQPVTQLQNIKFSSGSNIYNM